LKPFRSAFLFLLLFTSAWVVLWVLVSKEESLLEKEYAEILSPSNQSFGYIQELSKKSSKNDLIFELTYVFKGASGTSYNALESIPFDMYKKLKLGDSLMIYRREIAVFGKVVGISRIPGNPNPPPLLSTTLLFLQSGMKTLTLLCVMLGVATVWESRSQKDLLEGK